MLWSYIIIMYCCRLIFSRLPMLKRNLMVDHERSELVSKNKINAQAKKNWQIAHFELMLQDE
jgi:hypothetical protein